MSRFRDRSARRPQVGYMPWSGIRIIAANHDTSVAMIERNYSEFITDHTDALARAAMLEIPEPTEFNVMVMN